MIRTTAFVVASLILVALARPADQSSNELTSLEGKLHGAWTGGPCQGEFILGADGTFERQHYSPGSNQLAGTWEVRWDALPPTMVLSCETSDAQEFVGKTWEVKLVHLDNKALAYQHPGQRPVRYKRLTK